MITRKKSLPTKLSSYLDCGAPPYLTDKATE